jgi:hypothetical protein
MSVSLDANAECPFFMAQGEKYIRCEGYMGAKVIHRNEFRHKVDRLKFFRDVCCCDGGRKCMHYRVLSAMYDKGVLK